MKYGRLLAKKARQKTDENRETTTTTSSTTTVGMYKRKIKTSLKNNHDSSVRMMELVCVKRIFRRSREKGRVNYKHYIENVNVKTFKMVSMTSLICWLCDRVGNYDSMTFILYFFGQKIINWIIFLVTELFFGFVHVLKRMGTRFRNIVQEWKGMKLFEKKVNKWERQNDKKNIDKLSTFYKNVILALTII